MSVSGLKALVRNLYALQEERVEAYRLFDLGHQAYLRSSPNYDFIQYRQLVHEITQAFNRISKEVIQLKDRFHEEYDRPDLSEHVERMQEREREKLELVRQPSCNLPNRICWTIQAMRHTRRRPRRRSTGLIKLLRQLTTYFRTSNTTLKRLNPVNRILLAWVEDLLESALLSLCL
ncbi:required for excision 1-B domain-containing protein isoform X1 [Scyliorhinus canicula]|uniref:required for excision 1-B domain-containing protein isoform X1 n=1 Tax=Scyliorhinus canicula TaxID=7830 RepID=UPI0018F40C1F|nr:required for excision 1-B domain-containing protein isoform X1 [Scyliorhinus canicula]